jgi:predicted acylesterase/phospholipase RssA
MAVPGIFAPVAQDDDLLIDGGIINQSPFSILPDDIDKFIIIFVSPYERISAQKSPNLTDVLENSIRLMQYEITKLRLQKIPAKRYLMLAPELGSHAILEEKKHFPEIIRLGFETAYQRIDELRAFIK